MKLRIVLLLAAAVSTWAAEHNRLLPQPQRVIYGSGRLPVEGLPIRFAAPPATEDQFAANQISQGLASVLGHPAVAAGTTPALQLIREGDGAALPQNDETTGSASRESYTLRVTPEGAEIRARSSAGLFYGAQTLLQLIEGAGTSAFVPSVEIEDWPSLAYRGVMFDMSHGPLPTVEEIKRQLDFMARFKANQYYFYTELSVELKGYSLLNPDARYTQDEVRQIVSYARERHIDVVPCLELYGHLHDLFRVERYAGMSALPHSGEINPRHPQILPMMREWVDQMVNLFPSPWFHIGLDEPWELEHAGQLSGFDPATAYFDHLRTMAETIRQRGKRPMFWAEVSSAAGAGLFTRYPERMKQLPPDVIAMTWDYSVKSDYSPVIAPLARLKIPTMVASGIAAYQEIAPDFDMTFANIDGLVRDTRKFGVMGTVATDWADDAQLFYRATLPAIAYGCAAAWQNTPMDRGRFFDDYAARLYPPAVVPEIAAALKSLAQAEVSIKKALGDHDFQRMWDDPLFPARLKYLQDRAELLRKTRLDAENAQEHLQRALALGGQDWTVPSLIVSARLLDYTGMKFLYALEIADVFARRIPSNPTQSELEFWIFNNTASYDHARLVDLMDTITGLKESYRSAWLAEYTPYRMGTILGRFDGEYEYWRRLQSNFLEYQRTFKDKDPVWSLERLRPWGLR